MSRTLIDIASCVLKKSGLAQEFQGTQRFSTPTREVIDSEIREFNKLSLIKPPTGQFPINIILYRSENSVFAVTDIIWPDHAAKLLLSHSDQISQINEPYNLLYFAIINDLDLKPEMDNLELYIEEYINGPVKLGSFVDPQNALSLFKNISIFSFDRNYSGFESNEVIFQIMSIFDPRVRGSACTDDIINMIADLAIRKIPNLPTKNLINAISAHSIRYTFLELYKCLEFSFIVPRVKELKTRLNTDGNTIKLDHFDFAKILYQKLGWKRVERDSIQQIFKYIHKEKPVLFNNLSEWYPNPPPTNQVEIDKIINEISEKYYQVRNNIVHQLWPDEIESVRLNEKQMIQIVDFTILAINFIYVA